MRWSSPRIEGAWDGSIARYWLLVRMVYRWKETGQLRYADRLLQNPAAIDPSNGIPIVPDPSPSYGNNQDIPILVASGSFDGVQGIALYNVDLSYNAEVDTIRVYAKPSTDTTVLPNAAFLIATEESPPAPPRGWHPASIAGPYDGSNQYAMCIEVQYVGLTDPVLLRGSFSGINGSGTIVPLE